MTFSEPRRSALLIAYVLFLAAGLAALVWPSQAVADTTTRLWVWLWATLFIVGGAACLWGTWRRRWLGEYAGLPALTAVWLVFALASGWQAVTRGEPQRWAGALGFLAVAVFMVARWVYVARDRSEARARRHAEGS